ncbi:hypothetical protein ABH926_005523 [Catenulispora sp. GP43]|uniref:hypothetical protein n=1 Tax=Catenulispora sp. GP43 TaxID=3156263 RepID=UPI00351714FC
MMMNTDAEKGRPKRDSRWRRKHQRPAPAGRETWWAPRDRSWWIGVLFAIGSALFALGVLPAYANAVGLRADGLTFFAGSVFFTSAGFLQYREAVDAAPAGPRHGRRVLVWLPGRVDWQATAWQSVGTLAFNVSTGLAVGATIGSDLYRRHVWRPDAVGSVCFLVASTLAWYEACHGWFAWRPRSVAWWITLANLAGSVAFGVSAAAAFVQPGTADLLSSPVANLGTLIGAVLFLLGAVLLLVERNDTEGASRSQSQ